jgi:L-iditol 2-dehydrogenase
MDLAHLRVGMRVGVFGCGPIGLLILQLARQAGASSLIATDVLPHRLEAACLHGATHVFPATDPLASEALGQVAGPHGLDVVFETAGDNAAVEAAVAHARPGGKVMLVGIPPDDRTSFSASLARRKGLTLRLVRRMKNTYPRAIHLVATGRVDVRSLVTHTFPLEKAAEAFALASRREGLKVVIQVS